jgi:DNA-directed RNA polymerase subunit RPC12/RpoP
MNIKKTTQVCNLRIDQCTDRFGGEVWFLIDEGREDPETGLGLTIAQGTRQQIAQRVCIEMAYASTDRKAKSDYATYLEEIAEEEGECAECGAILDDEEYGDELCCDCGVKLTPTARAIDADEVQA